MAADSSNLSSNEVVDQFRRLYMNMRRDYEVLKSSYEKVLSEKNARETEVTHQPPPVSENNEAPPAKVKDTTAYDNLADDDNIEGDDDEDDKYVNHIPWMKDVENTLKDLADEEP